MVRARSAPLQPRSAFAGNHDGRRPVGCRPAGVRGVGGTRHPRSDCTPTHGTSDRSRHSTSGVIHRRPRPNTGCRFDASRLLSPCQFDYVVISDDGAPINRRLTSDSVDDSLIHLLRRVARPGRLYSARLQIIPACIHSPEPTAIAGVPCL